jgi:hypothetical protein
MCNTLILALKNNKKKYLISYYQPKEPQFCYVFICQYYNLKVHSIGRVKKNHLKISLNLNKNLKISNIVFWIYNCFNSIAINHKNNVFLSRLSNLKLGNRAFFCLVLQQIKLFALNLCNEKLLKAKHLYNITDYITNKDNNKVNPDFSYEKICKLSL